MFHVLALIMFHVLLSGQQRKHSGANRGKRVVVLYRRASLCWLLSRERRGCILPCNNMVMWLLITIKATYHVPFETNTIHGIGSNECSRYHIEVGELLSSIFCVITCHMFSLFHMLSWTVLECNHISCHRLFCFTLSCMSRTVFVHMCIVLVSSSSIKYWSCSLTFMSIVLVSSKSLAFSTNKYNLWSQSHSIFCSLLTKPRIFPSFYQTKIKAKSLIH